MFVILALLTTGCEIRPPATNPAESAHPNPSALIVVPAKYKPAGKLDPILRTKGKAAAGGAAQGALAGAGVGAAAAFKAVGPLAILLFPVVIPVGAVAGGSYESAHEASMAASEEAIKKGRQALDKVIAHLQLQQRLQQGIAASLQREEIAQTITVNSDIGPASAEDHPDYRQLNGSMVLEVAVQGFGFSRGISNTGKDGYMLDLTAHARLVDTKRHVVVDELQHMYQSQARTATEWLQDNAQGFMQAVDEGIRNTASDIVLEFFLLYYPPGPEITHLYPGTTIKPFPESVLQPISPSPSKLGEIRAHFTFKYVGGKGHQLFSKVDSLQPSFRWQAFPRPADLKGTHSNPDEFSDVSYEIAIFRDIRIYINGLFTDYLYAAGPQIYARSGLTEPRYHLETPLKPCGRYAWSVRAHFLLDGRPRVTEWTGMYYGGLPWYYRRYGEVYGEEYDVDTDYIPIARPKDYYLLFRTPPAAGVKKCAE